MNRLTGQKFVITGAARAMGRRSPNSSMPKGAALYRTTSLIAPQSPYPCGRQGLGAGLTPDAYHDNLQRVE